MKGLFTFSVFLFFCFVQVAEMSAMIYSRYIPGSDTISADWNNVSYNDTAWQYGYKQVGFGNMFDSTIIEKCNSLYLRYPFQLSNVDSVKDLVISATYDDGFVAYVNGVEILRKNMGKAGDPTQFDMLADRSHGMFNVSLSTYYISEEVISGLLKKGDNVFAVEVHNDSVGGSDLGFDCSLMTRTFSSFDPYANEWRALNRIDLDSTKLPIVIIQSQGQLGIGSRRTMAQLSIITNDEGRYNKPTDEPNEYGELANCEVRGQSSSGWAKKSYNIELKDMLGDTQDKKLLGMSKDNDWVLSANYTDRSMIRNMLVRELSRDLNVIVPDSRFVEVIIDGDYMGVYQLMEKMKRGKDRIDVEKQKPGAVTDISGGYIFKYDKSSNSADGEYSLFKNKGIELFLTYPEEQDLSVEQQDYLDDFWYNYFISLKDSVLFDEEKGFRNYIDVESFIDFSLINELSRNSDGFRFSTYMHKPKNEPLHFGPLWDFDLSFGNAEVQNGLKTDGFLFYQASNSVLMHVSCFKDPAFVKEFSDRYFQLRAKSWSNNAIVKTVDSLYSVIEAAGVRNYTAWPYNSYPVHSWVGTNSEIVDAPSDIAYLKSWTIERMAWLDDTIAKIHFPLDTYDTNPTTVSSVVQGTDELFYSSKTNTVISSNSSRYSLRVINSSGVTVYVTTGQGAHQLPDLPAGMFCVLCQFDSEPPVCLRFTR